MVYMWNLLMEVTQAISDWNMHCWGTTSSDRMGRKPVMYRKI
jgi:hypothetical protein